MDKLEVKKLCLRLIESQCTSFRYDHDTGLVAVTAIKEEGVKRVLKEYDWEMKEGEYIVIYDKVKK